MDLSQIIPAAGLGGLVTWAGQATNAYFRTRGERANKREETAITLRQHTDKIALELIRAAREEAAAARQEAAEARQNQIRFVHFDEAMEHLEAVLTATDPTARSDAERRGRQFLTRMKRFAEAHGAVRNEMQVLQSRGTMTGDAGLGDILKGLPDE